MRARRHLLHLLGPLLLVALALGPAAPADAQYVRPTGTPPTPADLAMTQGRSKTVVVRMLNLTPYSIGQDSSQPVNDFKSLYEFNRMTHETGMFAPVGYVNALNSMPGAWENDPETGWAYVPASPNTETHPLSMLVSWEDQGGYVTDAAMGYAIHDVWNFSHGATADVHLRLWFTRTKPSTGVHVGDFSLFSALVVEVADVMGLILEPENPIAWLDAFVASRELWSEGDEQLFDQENSEDDGTDKMYIAAYALPDGCPTGYTCAPQYIYTTGGDSATDGVAVQWASGTGEHAANIVVSTYVIRGSEARGVNDDNGCCGTLPVVAIVVWTSDQFLWAVNSYAASGVARLPEGKRINSYLKQHRRQGYRDFAQLYNSLEPRERDAYTEIVTALLREQPLRTEQKVFLGRFAEALERHAALTRDEDPEGRRLDREHERQRPDGEHERVRPNGDGTEPPRPDRPGERSAP